MLFIRAILLSLMKQKTFNTTKDNISSLFLYILVTAALTHFLHYYFILNFNCTNV